MLRKGRRGFAIAVLVALVLFIVIRFVSKTRTGEELGGARAAGATEEVPAPETGWFGAYLQGQKIGYMSESVRPLERDGQPALEYVSKNYIVLDVLGQRMEQSSVWVSLCDPDFRPRELQFTLDSGDRNMAVTAEFGATEIRCTRTSGDNTVTQVVPIPEGTELVVDGQALLGERDLPVGESLTVHQFNPVTFAIEPCTLTAERRETIALAGETVEATVVHVVSPLVTADVWVDDRGRMVQLVTPIMSAKLEFKRESEEVAQRGLAEAGPRIDLAVATAIRPTTPIPNPRAVAELELRVRGLDRLKAVPSGEWQTVAPPVEGAQTVVISAPGLTRSNATLPFEAGSLATAQTDQLAATPYIEADHPEMIAKAKDVLGGTTNVGEAIDQLHRFVHERIQWQANIGLFRSGLEILRDPAGVCRDAAALYTALARAAGIPTRVCAGLTYVNGAFLGHAWSESWTGDRWRPVDATLPGTFVDATHLKLAQGARYTAVFEMLPALGSLQIEVVRAAPRPE